MQMQLLLCALVRFTVGEKFKSNSFLKYSNILITVNLAIDINILGFPDAQLS